VLAFLVLVWIVEVPDSRTGRAAPYAVPVLMWLWANMHGSFALGFAYLVLHLGGRWLDGHPPSEDAERRLALGVVIASAVVFINPYGIELVTFPIALIQRSEILSRIVEWRSPSFQTDQGHFLAVWMVVFVLAIARTRSRLGWRDSVISVAFLVLAFWAQRNIIVTTLVLLPILARAVAVDEERTPATVRFGVLLVALLALLGVRGAVHAAAEPNFSLAAHPVKAMQYLDRHGLLGRRLLNDDGWGGYIILRYGPRQLVFIDDRYDMYPEAFINEYFGLVDGASGTQKALDTYRIDTVVWPSSRPLTQLLDTSPSWRRVYRDKLAAVYVRRDVLARRG